MIASRDANGSSSSRAGCAGQQGPGEGDALPHPARELARIRVGEVAEAEAGRASRSPGGVHRGSLRRSAAARWRRCRRPSSRAAAGRSAASRRSRSFAPAADGSPPTAIVPAPSGMQPADQLEQRRLSATGRPDERDGLAAADLEIQAVEHPQRLRSCARPRLTRIAPAGTGSGAVRVASVAASGGLFGDGDLPFARITAQVRRVSAGRGIPETLSQPAAREHPLMRSIIAASAGGVGAQGRATTSTKCSRCLVVQHSKASVVWGS